MARPARIITTLLFTVALGSGFTPAAQAQPAHPPATASTPADNNADYIAPGRENLEPAKPGFNDNTVDNQAGTNWHPTANPKHKVTPGQMRSDKEEIPGGFTKEQANRAEIQEAKEQGMQARSGIRTFAVVDTCRTYWPSPFKVCGKIREKYDSLRGPRSFLTWPRSDELKVPDGVGRRNEFLNGFIYWHRKTGAHPITTHFSVAWARTGWERGPLGYPTTDEFGLSDRIGRKQSFEHGHIYGSLAGLATIHGAIYDKWVQTGAEKGPLGYPTGDETKTPDGIGRFNNFTGGKIYWHPRYGAHPVSSGILDDWAGQGYERGKLGYPIADATTKDDIRYDQRFERGTLQGFRDPIPKVAQLLNISKDDINTFYNRFNELNKTHGVGVKDGWNGLLQQATYSAEATRKEIERLNNEPNNVGADYQNALFRSVSVDSGARNDCRPDQLVKPGNERTNRGDVFYSGATTTVKNVDVNHGHNGIFASVRGNSNPDLVDTVDAIGAEEGIRKIRGSERKGVCSPRYFSVNVDQQTRYRAADFADSKINPDGYDSSPGSYALSRGVTANSTKFNCAPLLWAAYMQASGGEVDIADSKKLPLAGYKSAVFPVDIADSINTTEFQ